MVERANVRIHTTAEVAPSAEVGEGTSIWNYSQVRERARIGRGCTIGRDVYVDFDVEIGDNVKIQNGAQLFHGVTIASGAFVGPGAILTNDKYPRAINPDGTLKSSSDWEVGPITIGYGAAIGAGAIVLPNVTVGRFALVAAGSVVARDVPDHGLVMGNPGRLSGYVCHCAGRLTQDRAGHYTCSRCGEHYDSYSGHVRPSSEHSEPDEDGTITTNGHGPLRGNQP